MMHDSVIQSCSTDPRASLQGCIHPDDLQIWNHCHLKQICYLLMQYIQIQLWENESSFLIQLKHLLLWQIETSLIYNQHQLNAANERIIKQCLCFNRYYY